MRFATVRVVLTIALGWLLAIALPPLLGIPSRWGTAVLMVSASIAGWVGLGFLRSRLARHVGATALPAALLARLWGAALAAAAVAWSAKRVITSTHPLVIGSLVLVRYRATYPLLELAPGI